jgi:hypothetical protein
MVRANVPYQPWLEINPIAPSPSHMMGSAFFLDARTPGGSFSLSRSQSRFTRSSQDSLRDKTHAYQKWKLSRTRASYASRSRTRRGRNRTPNQRSRSTSLPPSVRFRERRPDVPGKPPPCTASPFTRPFEARTVLGPYGILPVHERSQRRERARARLPERETERGCKETAWERRRARSPAVS